MHQCPIFSPFAELPRLARLWVPQPVRREDGGKGLGHTERNECPDPEKDFAGIGDPSAELRGGRLLQDSRSSCAMARRALASATSFRTLARVALVLAYLVWASFSFFWADFISEIAFLCRGSMEYPRTPGRARLAGCPHLAVAQPILLRQPGRSCTGRSCKSRNCSTSRCCDRASDARSYNFGKPQSNSIPIMRAHDKIWLSHFCWDAVLGTFFGSA